MVDEADNLKDNFNVKSLTYTGVVYKDAESDICQVALAGVGGAISSDLESLTDSVNEALQAHFGDEVDYLLALEAPPGHEEVINDPDLTDDSTIGYVTSVVSTDGESISFETRYHALG